MRKNSKIEQKYFNFLVDFKRKLDKGDSKGLHKFAKSRRINTGVYGFLRESGYIKKFGTTHVWVGKDPSIKTVTQMRQYFKDVSLKSKMRTQQLESNVKPTKVVVNTLKKRRSVKDIPVNGATEIKVVNPKVIYTKVLFGLFTLKSTIQY